MNQRSRLSLSPATDQDKKQPQGFAPTSVEHPEGKVDEAGDQPQPRPESLSASAGKGIDTLSRGGVDAGRIVKILFIVSVAALSILLLKRRLF